MTLVSRSIIWRLSHLPYIILSSLHLIREHFLNRGQKKWEGKYKYSATYQTGAINLFSFKISGVIKSSNRILVVLSRFTRDTKVQNQSFWKQMQHCPYIAPYQRYHSLLLQMPHGTFYWPFAESIFGSLWSKIKLSTG